MSSLKHYDKIQASHGKSFVDIGSGVKEILQM